MVGGKVGADLRVRSRRLNRRPHRRSSIWGSPLPQSVARGVRGKDHAGPSSYRKMCPSCLGQEDRALPSSTVTGCSSIRTRIAFCGYSTSGVSRAPREGKPRVCRAGKTRGRLRVARVWGRHGPRTPAPKGIRTRGQTSLFTVGEETRLGRKRSAWPLFPRRRQVIDKKGPARSRARTRGKVHPSRV